MISDNQAVLDAGLRYNFPTFLAAAFATVEGSGVLLENWHHNAIAHQLNRVRHGKINRLIVTMPPRYLKSITISVAWVAWLLGHDPTKEIVCVSYSAELAQKHARDCLAVVNSEWFKRVFPETRLKRGAAAGMDFETTRGGGRLSTSVGGTLTGRGGNVIIIDDPIKPDEAMSENARRNVKNWYSNTLTTRLNDKINGVIVLVMQRLHEDDLAGHLLESGGWHHLCLPAIARFDEEIRIGPGKIHFRKEGQLLHPEREPIENLDAQKSNMGSSAFSTQYQQAPAPAEGLFIKSEWLRYQAEHPVRQPGDRVVQSWDTASKDGVANDWSVCVTALLRKNEVFILDVHRAKLQFPDLLRQTISLAREHDTDVLLIEDAASGQQLIQTMKHQSPRGVPTPIPRTPEADKVTRFAGVSARIEAGNLILPEHASWLAEFEHEILGFPSVRYKDQADALAQLLDWRPAPERLIGAAPEIIRCLDIDEEWWET